MNGVRAGFLRGPDDFVDVEVILARPVADQDRLIGKPQKVGLAVGFFINGHRVEAHLLDRADNAQSDFPPVGHQYFRYFFCQFLSFGLQAPDRPLPDFVFFAFV